MTLEIWFAFVAVVFVFAIIPGPTVIMVIGQAVSNGRSSVTPLVAGVLLGDFTAMTLSLIGLGAVLATSATLFSVLKWFGVAYLIYLGIKAWTIKPEEYSESSIAQSASRFAMFKASFLVTALNPKDIVFFVAFLPQFIDPASATLPQVLILMMTFLSIIAITVTSFALFAGSIRHKMQGYQARRRLNKVSGSALVGAGLLASMMHRQ